MTKNDPVLAGVFELIRMANVGIKHVTNDMTDDVQMRAMLCNTEFETSKKVGS